MKKSKKWLWFIPAGIVIALVAGFLYLRSKLPSASGELLSQLDTVVLERGPLLSMIGATGNVRPAQSAILGWQTSGKVEDVLVQTGQKVETDQELAVIDPESLASNILQAQVELINAQEALDKLYEPDALVIAQAEAMVEDAQSTLDDLLNPTDLAISQAGLAVINAQESVDDAQHDLDQLNRGRGSQSQISLAQADYLLAQEKVDQLQDYYENVGGDPAEDPAKALALSNLAAAKNARDRALASLNWYQGKPSEAELSEKQAKLDVAKAQLAEAQQKLADLQSPTPSAIDLARAKLADAQEKLADLKDGPSVDDVTIAQNRLTQAQAVLNQQHLTAPFAGTITQVDVLPGDVVSPGKVALRLDDLSKMYVELNVSEVDIELIQVGQPVSVTLDAVLDREYSGEVVEIGQIGDNSQGVVSFVVTIQIKDADRSVKPGMTAEADIIIAREEEVLQLPNRAIQDEESGKHFVWVMDRQGPKQVFVQVGRTSANASEVISSELKEGDTILVNLPDNFGGGFMMGGPGMRRRIDDGGQP